MKQARGWNKNKNKEFKSDYSLGCELPTRWQSHLAPLTNTDRRRSCCTRAAVARLWPGCVPACSRYREPAAPAMINCTSTIFYLYSLPHTAVHARTRTNLPTQNIHTHTRSDKHTLTPAQNWTRTSPPLISNINVQLASFKYLSF